MKNYQEQGEVNEKVNKKQVNKPVMIIKFEVQILL